MASLLSMARAISRPAASVNKYVVSVPLFDITAKRNSSNRGAPVPTKRRTTGYHSPVEMEHEDRSKPWHMSGGHIGGLFEQEYTGPKPQPEDFGAEFQAVGQRDDAKYPNYEIWSSQWRDPRPKIPYDDPGRRRYHGEPVPMPYEAYHMLTVEQFTEKESKQHVGMFFKVWGAILTIVWLEYRYGLAPALEYREPVRLPNNSAWVLYGGDPDIEPTPRQIEEANLRNRQEGTAIHSWM